MIKTDLHTHTYYCDGKDSPEDMVLSAISKGFENIGFSGHSYAPYDPDCCMSPEGSLEYRKVIESLKAKYKGRINIYCGIEQDIYAPFPEKPYDYSIGSVHYLRRGEEYLTVDYTPGILKDACERYFGGDIYSMAECYFETVSGVAEATGCSIIGHFDLISKFNENREFFDPDNTRYVSAWKAAADRLLGFGIPFEINTGAISRGWRSQPYPSMDMIRYIAERGGRFVLSSDAHSKENIGFQFEKMEAFLKEKAYQICDISEIIKL